jgi:kumamolisin
MQDHSRHLMSISGWTRKFAAILCGIALAGGLQPASQAQSAPTRITFANSVKTVTAPANAAVNQNVPTVVRRQLTDAEIQETIDFSIALKLRNLIELQERIGMGEIIALDEMAVKYFPASADLDNVRRWLIAQGFEVPPAVPHEVSVFARGTVAQLQRAFGVAFARVQFHGEEHTSAVTAPSLPADVAEPVLSVNGLQPHLHPFPHSVRKAVGVVKSISNQPPYLVSEITKAYDASSETGAAQKIGIVIDTFPRNSDLSTFWQDNGVLQSLGNIEKVQVVSGSLPAPSGEETLDTEWSSGIASGAKVRIYATTDLSLDHLDQAYQYIINDLPNQPTLHQLSLSYGLGELYMPTGQMDTDAQYFRSIAGQGVTIFVSSGDGGSNPGTDGSYDSTNPVQVESPANDLNVTAVGGTSLYLNSNGTVSNETSWFNDTGGTGGGQSQHFARPFWQPRTGPVPPQNGFAGRLVPDVASDADPDTGVLVILNGLEYQFGGTSLSAPTWAAFCARINQARSDSKLPQVGRLNFQVYPFIGTANFRDIAAGSNGVYNAGTGFDLCTGVGAPDVNTLVGTLGGPLVQGSGVAKDFNNDGFADLVWENTSTGQRAFWLLNNGTLSSYAYLPGVDPQWHVTGVGDFLGNGQSDLVWEDPATGAHTIWILNKGVYIYSLSVPIVGGSWHVVGAGDFNSDGEADLVWENTSTGERAIWLLKKGVYQSVVHLPTVSTDWHIAGVGDFNGDHQADLGFENKATGQRAIWFLANGTLEYGIYLPTEPSAWQIAGTADFNSDGQGDLVWENTLSGARAIWFMKNGNLQSYTYLPTVPTDWHIVDH